MARVPDRGAIYNAAQRWKEECLIGEASVFGARDVWAAAHLDALDAHFVRQPAAPGDTFDQKLEHQLADAGAGAQRLMAEMVWVMMLAPIPAAVAHATKQRLVRRIWSWSGAELAADHPMLGAPLRDGLAHTGAGFGSNRAAELTFFVALLRSLKARTAPARRVLLDDPWAASEWASEVQGSSRPQMRHVVLHLLFPDSFEAIVATRDRRMILEAFDRYGVGEGPQRPYSGDPLTAADQRLLDVRSGLEREHPGVLVHYYRSPWRERWQATPGRSAEENGSSQGSQYDSVESGRSRVHEDVGNQCAWAIGAGEGGTRWPDFREHGRVAIGWDELGDLREFPDRDAIRRRMKEVYAPRQEPTMWSLACWQFCRDMAVGDEVFVKQGRDRLLARGVVTGEYAYDATRPDYRHVRAVRWTHVGEWAIEPGARVATKTLTEVTAYEGMLRQWHAMIGLAPGSPSYAVADALADGVFLARDELERTLSALRRRKNLILQGAPGVGKSFVARRLAYALIGAKRPDNVQTVQFHQSYAYEDFVQGWRPTEGGFALRNGIFYEFCARARGRPGEPHVFVIDEINRGNLSKILGELLLLIEADKRGPEHAIPLTYSQSAEDRFSVPENVYLVGLMNTADRSLAMVDYALRRRFAFVTLAPALGSDAFAAHLSARGVGETVRRRVVERVGRVNALIASDTKNLGPGFAIGHSYFTPAEPVPDDEAWYAAVVEEEIRPLLDEYWFDDPGRVEECLRMLRP